MTSDAASSGTMPRRVPRLERTVAAYQSRRAVARLQDECPYPIAILRAPGENTLRLHALDPHSVCPVADRVADLRMLELGQDTVGAVHVQAEEVLDPVVGVRPAARRWAHLRNPWPDRRGRGIDADRPRRDPISCFEQLVAGQRCRSLRFRSSPGEDRLAQKPSVENGRVRRPQSLRCAVS